MNIEDNAICNKSSNRRFVDVLKGAATRRGVLAGGLALAATGFFGPSVALARNNASGSYRVRNSKLMSFEPVMVAAGSGPEPSISPHYEYDVLIPWGSPLQPGGPTYGGDPHTRPSAREQAQMIGIGHDGMWFFPYRRKRRSSSRHGMLCINHEFGRNTHVLGKEQPDSLEDVRLSQHAHGVSVVAIAMRRGHWRQLRSKNNRRIHVNTPMYFSGPVAGHELLMTPNGNIALGTVNNCSNGHTPWGTYLTCEENFNGYFAATNEQTTWFATPEQERYGFDDDGFGYGWEKFDKRFDLSDPDYRNEENRFGWVVEIQPFNPGQTPVKRTALGRFKHEGATVTVGTGNRAVVYMGDDQRFDYIYKFVSADDWQYMLSEGVSPLDEGALYVARFDEDGTGEWLELTRLSQLSHFPNPKLLI